MVVGTAIQTSDRHKFSQDTDYLRKRSSVVGNTGARRVLYAERKPAAMRGGV